MSRKLHIGGKIKKAGWEILNALPGPDVDHTCNANDLSKFEDSTFTEIYASHIVEHFDYVDELGRTLTEWKRVLAPKGKIYISVPDMDILAKLFLLKEQLTADQRFHVMRMMFGGHVDEYDHHSVGLNAEFLGSFLIQSGYTDIQRVTEFKLFDDTSSLKFGGVLISLNMIAEKPAE
ncbi:MAG: putative SAM-dependent methyltransferase [Oleiphilaceae bacterium]|jgi:predicted SAM-dependent methyltransferase